MPPLLQVITADLQRQLDAAVVREAWEDAEALQQELTALIDQLAAASDPYSFQPVDAQDLLERLQPRPSPAISASDAPTLAQAADAKGSAAQTVAAPDTSTRAKTTTGAAGRGKPDTEDAGLGDTASDSAMARHQQLMLAAAAVAAEVPVDGQPAGMIPSASRARLEEGYAADSDSSVSVLKLSQSAADIAASVHPSSPVPVGNTVASTPEHGPDLAAAATTVQEEHRKAHTAQPASRSELHDARSPDTHDMAEPAAVIQPADSLSSHLSELQRRETSQQPAENADASATSYPHVAADVVDSRTESSADGLTPSVSRTYLEGYAADSDTSIGGRNRHAAHSMPAGPAGSADLASRPTRSKGAAVSPIPEGEQLPTGVPEALPPPAPPLSMLDRHESGNLADAEDELPGERGEQHPAHVVTADDIELEGNSREALSASDAEQSMHEPLTGTMHVGTRQASMFAGLDLA